MLKNNFLPLKNISKILRKIIILSIIVCFCMSIMDMCNNVQAVQMKYDYSSESMSKYPGYDNLINNLKKNHPNWSFTILDTGLDWNDVIKNETVAVHGRNLIYYTYNGGWVCSNCGNKTFDSGKWKCASEATVAYYMDPRNWLNENNIFQFENLAYNGGIQNIDGVNKILSTVGWAKGDTIAYTKNDGTVGILNKSYSQIIMEAAQEAGISPYHLAARIKQEQGSGQYLSGTASGTYLGYLGYYNFLNIKATGSSIIGNALRHAQNEGWDDPEKSIKGGARFIASDYINRGQSTLYLQKFDVDNSDGALYYHQYMQNVSAALSEGNMVRSSYESMGLIDASLNFVIPVYNNMPKDISLSPDGIAITTQNVKVTGDLVAVREGRSTSTAELAKVNSGDILVRIEVNGIKENGHYWDKVVLPDGRKGYIARDYIELIDDVTDKNEPAFANTGVNLRNGPGTVNTSIIMTLTKGQSVTILESGKYNVDGYNWSRVKLTNGTQGYLVSDYVTVMNEEKQEKQENTQKNNKPEYIIGYVNCNPDGIVNIRSGIGTGNSIITALGKDTKVTVIQKSAGSANGYNWDKIVTTDGLEGYIANAYMRYEEPKSDAEIQSNEPEVTPTPTPTPTPSPTPTATPTPKPTEEVKPTETKKEEKFGYDVDGNNEVNSGDLYQIVMFLKNNFDKYEKKYDVNNDNAVNSGDLYEIVMYLKKH